MVYDRGFFDFWNGVVVATGGGTKFDGCGVDVHVDVIDGMRSASFPLAPAIQTKWRM